MNDTAQLSQGDQTGLSDILYDEPESTNKKASEARIAPDGPAPKKLVIAGYLLAAAALFVLFAGIKAAQSIVGPFCLACFLAVILAAPLRWLKSKGFSDLVASLVISAGVLIGGLSIIWILAGSVNQFMARIPHYTNRFNDTLESIDNFLEPHGMSLLGGPKEVKTSQAGPILPVERTTGQPAVTEASVAQPADVGVVPENEVAEAWDASEKSGSTVETGALSNEASVDEDRTLPPFSFTEAFTPQERAEINTVGIAGYVRWAAMELGRLGALCFIVMILVVFMMIEASRLPKKILLAFGTQGITNEHLQAIGEKIWKYMKIKSIISFFVGIFVWLLLVATGVEYPMLWGLLAFFLNYIPNIGSIIAAVPGVALALFDHGVGICIIVTIGYLVINQTLGYYVEPIFLGDRLGISPLVVLLSMVFWGWLLGLIGMFLSAPLTIVVKIVLDSFNETRWVSILMDDKC